MRLPLSFLSILTLFNGMVAVIVQVTGYDAGESFWRSLSTSASFGAAAALLVLVKKF